MQPQNRAVRAQSEAKIARVSVSDAEGFGTVGASETRGILLAAPRGVDSMPCEGDRVLLHSAGGTQVCAGALCNTQGLAPGEVRLHSAGGACIVLRNNGEIVLNGLVITPQGEIRPPAP